MTVAIDKLDKIGLDGVVNELEQRGFDNTATDTIKDLLTTADLESLKLKLQHTPSGQEGFAELDTVNSYLEGYNFVNTRLFDPTLARGLSYYTGCIFEVKANGVAMGSIGGGGRYANLTGAFGLPGLSGVGISFGADRIYDVLTAIDGFPADLANDLTLLFVAFDADSHRYAFQTATQLRLAGVAADVYPEPVKIQKQMKYANERGVPFVAICGSDELAQRTVMLKNMTTGTQETVSVDQLADFLKQG
jgi:histidyl-tRNA synthetase